MAGDYNANELTQQVAELYSVIADSLKHQLSRRSRIPEKFRAPAPFTEVGVRREGEQDYYCVLWTSDDAPPQANSIAAMMSMDGAISARMGERTAPRLGFLDLITARRGPVQATPYVEDSRHSSRAAA